MELNYPAFTSNTSKCSYSNKKKVVKIVDSEIMKRPSVCFEEHYSNIVPKMSEQNWRKRGSKTLTSTYKGLDENFITCIGQIFGYDFPVPSLSPSRRISFKFRRLSKTLSISSSYC